MNTRQSMLISMFTAVTMLFTFMPAYAAEMDVTPVLNLSEAQIEKLGDTIAEFGEKALDIVLDIDDNFQDLEQELKKDDRLDSKLRAKSSAHYVNRRIKKISSLYVELLTLRVEYLLEVKNELSDEQKLLMLEALLVFNMDVPEEFSIYLDVEITPLGIELSTEQIKQLLDYKSQMEIAEIQSDLDLAYQLLDLRDEILAEEWNSKHVDKIVTSVADIGAKSIENQVGYILKAKDVLTLEQKRTLSHQLMLSDY